MFGPLSHLRSENKKNIRISPGAERIQGAAALRVQLQSRLDLGVMRIELPRGSDSAACRQKR